MIFPLEKLQGKEGVHTQGYQQESMYGMYDEGKQNGIYLAETVENQYGLDGKVP